MAYAAIHRATGNKVAGLAWRNFDDTGARADVDHMIDADLRNDNAVDSLSPDKAQLCVLMHL